ncbi:amino acid ABC transporter substrate-binding protein [Sporosarcina sp. ACRSM]|uniref:amino acid ABC transporter substrate-binding protein n=1 Tax=Sporosarcina sp. ACRSM TaxID=2918216 RepID=UPI001EF3F4E4|nr:amino acid ABC transporter substrate-binding protein [Sporosarcina sp. ACRSM]MCG7335647.1 amino acid ABC transporter substrate-binding protein [Sporosarcina sp. ACRSM]
MRKSLLSFLLLISAVVLLAACGTAKKEGNTASGGDTEKTSNASTDLLANIQEKGELVIGTEGVYPPFTFHDDSGQLTGFDVDIATEVAKRLGVKPVFLETQWDAMFAGLDAKRFDMVANQVGISDERLEKYDFSTPYNISVGVVVAGKDKNDISKYEDIKGLKAAQTMTSNHRKIAESYGAEIVSVEGFVQSVDLISSNRVDVTVNDKLSVLDYLKQRPDAPVKIVAQYDEAINIGLLFRKNNETLVEAVNQALQDMIDDGTHLEISEKWFGEDVLQ